MFQKNKKIELYPKLSFAISLMYMASADDGHIDNREMAYLSTVMRENSKILNEANRYIKQSIKHGFTLNDFLKKSNEFLSINQKECIVLNLIDLMFSDGNNAPNQEMLISLLINEYKLDEYKYAIYRELLEKKNDHSIF